MPSSPRSGQANSPNGHVDEYYRSLYYSNKVLWVHLDHQKPFKLPQTCWRGDSAVISVLRGMFPLFHPLNLVQMSWNFVGSISYTYRIYLVQGSSICTVGFTSSFWTVRGFPPCISPITYATVMLWSWNQYIWALLTHAHLMIYIY
jgi:hypothetical protein